MKTIAVRVWQMKGCWVHNGQVVCDEIYAAYPETSDAGCDLISCLDCGTVYAVDRHAELYGIPLKDRLEMLKCVTCGSRLAESSAQYPHRFRHSSGEIATFETPYREYPPIDLSIVKEFPAIYD